MFTLDALKKVQWIFFSMMTFGWGFRLYLLVIFTTKLISITIKIALFLYDDCLIDLLICSIDRIVTFDRLFHKCHQLWGVYWTIMFFFIEVRLRVYGLENLSRKENQSNKAQLDKWGSLAPIFAGKKPIWSKCILWWWHKYIKT